MVSAGWRIKMTVNPDNSDRNRKSAHLALSGFPIKIKCMSFPSKNQGETGF
jgi:hypothetical protein